jgi:hypothetical protein
MSLRDLRAVSPADAGPEQSREPPRGPRYFKTIAEFCREFEPPSYAIDGIIRSSSLYSLTAKTGAGKTSLLVAITLAVATGNEGLIGRDVEKGRVVFFCGENPDDFRMRLMCFAWNLNINLDELGDRVIVRERRDKPEQMATELAAIAKDHPIALVIVDTFAAFFDGNDVNSPTQSGEFMRRLRPMCLVDGKPSVIAACHPTKNAGEDALIPYGAGAILNEVDGNLTLWKDGALTTLHWQGKIRGADFPPMTFRIEELSCETVVDARGKQISLPVIRPVDERAVEQQREHGVDFDIELLRKISVDPKASLASLGVAMSATKSKVQRAVQNLKQEKLVELLGKLLVLTPRGEKLLKKQQGA